MNQIGSTPPVIPVQIKPASGQAKVSSDATPTLPKASGNTDQVVDAQAAEQRRYETIQRLAEGIANLYVVGDKRFTIFKDVSGQYITRFTSLRDGRVTYIPEPQLLRMSSSAPSPSLKINV
jgi:hypothetical protein